MARRNRERPGRFGSWPDVSMTASKARFRYRVTLAVFITALVASGLTAIPVEREVAVLASWLGVPPDADPAQLSGLRYWIAHVREGLEQSYARYPFLAYGNDWLAFGHLVIALFFFRPLVRPGEDRWVLVVGMIACVAVVPWAFVFGALRGIPLMWRLIDCSFGVLGILPLIYCYRLSRIIASETA